MLLIPKCLNGRQVAASATRYLDDVPLCLDDVDYRMELVAVAVDYRMELVAVNVELVAVDVDVYY